MIDTKTISQLLGICKSVDGEFTLNQLVGRVLHEKPRMVHIFPDAWSELLRSNRVRVRRDGRPCTYEVVRSD